MGFIYKITNQVNGNVYIGQTTRSIPIRWKEHVRTALHSNIKYISLLYYAIRHYGEESFKVEELEKCEDSFLDEREQYWIEQYGSRNSGYNINIGGQGTPKTNTKKVLELWEKGYSAKQIAGLLNVDRQGITRRLKGNGVTVYEILSRGNKAASGRKKKVVRISEDGNDVVLYNSLTEASEANNISVARICMVCSGERETSGGFRWKYHNGNDLPEKFKPQYSTRKTRVFQYDLDGQYLRSFNSIAEAIKFIGKGYGSAISCCCSGKLLTAYGYRWSYEKFNQLPYIKDKRKDDRNEFISQGDPCC